MDKLLQLTTFGLKNIEKPIVLDFSNQTINKGINKINSIKGIYGYNGAGKTAFITSVDIYRKIVTDSNYLVQNSTQNYLNELLNKKINTFYISTVFKINNDLIVKHGIELSRNEITNLISFKSENIGVLVGRTLNEKFKTIIYRENNKLKSFDDSASSFVKGLEDVDLGDSSFIPFVLNKFLIYFKENDIEKVSIADQIIITLFLNMSEMFVYIQNSSDYINSITSRSDIIKLLSKHDNIFDFSNINDEHIYLNKNIVFKNDFEQYEKSVKGLTKFIRLFKPELVDIRLEKIEDNNKYHLKKIFVYEDYSVDLSYESSGIKSLVELYSYLKKCAEGRLVFIDEMDVNINAIYFKKLVSYFANFGKGQLVFTTHNIESMEAIKNQRRSINIIGHDGFVDTWVSIGNRSPIKDYFGGYFEHSPMNIEDFDFISIFEGEE